MSATTKQIVGTIISLTSRVDALETKITDHNVMLDGWNDCFKVFHDRLDHLEQPKAIDLTGDVDIKVFVQDVTRKLDEKDAVITALQDLVFRLQDQLDEVTARLRS